jgi:dynein heavy chain 1
LHINVPVSKMRLGDVLDAKMMPLDDKKMREVFVTAQGEIAIESFLAKLKAYWETYSITFSVYKSKCRLIRG